MDYTVAVLNCYQESANQRLCESFKNNILKKLEVSDVYLVFDRYIDFSAKMLYVEPEVQAGVKL